MIHSHRERRTGTTSAEEVSERRRDARAWRAVNAVARMLATAGPAVLVMGFVIRMFLVWPP